MKVRVIAYRNQPIETGVLSGGNYSATESTITINVSGASATSVLLGQNLIDAKNRIYGAVTVINSSTSITLNKLKFPLSTGDKFYLLKENTYELDLQEEPNISLNYQFADIREPEKRKASYSQTFKLPFTDRNNDFFQNWYNVNLGTLVYSTKRKFNAILYVGTIPQFEGTIQLKAVYQKAGLYEVVLLSNSADLFTRIGTKKLREALSSQLDHQFNIANVKASWDGSTDGFFNIAPSPVSLRDSSVNVQKVMYPFQFTVPKAYYDGSNSYLGMNDPSAYDSSVVEDYIVPVTQFRPAIQIKELFKLIVAQAGFSYTSNFIDGNYFGKLFMTTCGHLGQPSAVVRDSVASVDGFMLAGNSVPWGTVNVPAGYNSSYSCGDEIDYIKFEADTDTPLAGYSVPQDPAVCWEASISYFTKRYANMNSMTIKFIYKTTNVAPANASTGFGCVNPNQDILWELEIRRASDDFLVNYAVQQGGFNGDVSVGYVNYKEVIFNNLDLNGLNVNESCYIQVRPRYYALVGNSQDGEIIIGGSQCVLDGSLGATCDVADYSYNGLYSQVRVDWVGFANNVYTQNISVKMGIDNNLTQKDFIKDIIQRFNLVVITDPDNDSNLIIEPYNDFVASGGLLHWTDKLDVSKEIVVKDTTSLQKQRLSYSDLEDVDLLNKSIKEEANDYNVYGKVDIRETFNQYASGELKNTAIFSPYINEKIFQSNNSDLPTILPNIAAQYEFTYKKTETGYEDVLENTNSKLFYYNGSATLIADADNIYVHSIDAGSGAVTAHALTHYPLCSPFDLTPDANGVSTITEDTNSLYWNVNPPVCGQLSVFNYSDVSTLSFKSLYFKYWQPYLSSIYSEEGRIVECFVNLNETDIFNFSFADEVFIKDAYYRVLNISNYQVGAKASTKVTLLKVDQTYSASCPDCDYVPATTNAGDSTVGPFLIFAPSTNPTQAFSFPTSLLTTEECCDCFGGDTFLQYTAAAPLYPCLANTGSLPVRLQTLFNVRSIFSEGITRKLYSGKIDGLNQPLLIGSNTDKFSTPIVPYAGDDIAIKYKTSLMDKPLFDGESHRVVLLGDTTGNTRGYAYSKGDSNTAKITIPPNSNVAIRVKGTATVVGGTSTTYTLGNVEYFGYITAFVSKGGTISQIGVTGSTSEFRIKDLSTPALTCSLYIVNDGNTIDFGLDDSQTDTRRVWQLTVDIDVNRIPNIGRSYTESYAKFQNDARITLQNGEYLLWN
jgi:hypothetical protein